MFLKFLYGVVAGISDLYFLAFLTGTIQAISTVVLKRPVPAWIIIVSFLACLLASILYHSFLANRVNWLTPGELIVGKQVKNGDKEWHNPYGRNRLVFFLVALVSIVVAGNVWDSLGSGAVYRFSQVLLKALPVAALYYGLIEMGQGRLKGVIYVIAYFAILLLNFMTSPFRDAEIQSFMLVFTVIGIIVYLLIAGVYHFVRRPEIHTS